MIKRWRKELYSLKCVPWMKFLALKTQMNKICWVLTPLDLNCEIWSRIYKLCVDLKMYTSHTHLRTDMTDMMALKSDINTSPIIEYNRNILKCSNTFIEKSFHNTLNCTCGYRILFINQAINNGIHIIIVEYQMVWDIIEHDYTFRCCWIKFEY